MSNLVTANTRVEWAEETPTEDEKMTYTFEDLILSNVLAVMHPKLPAIVEQKFHDKIKDKSCDICGKMFSVTANLERHKQRIHLGVRPFGCEKCTYKAKSTKEVTSFPLKIST